MTRKIYIKNIQKLIPQKSANANKTNGGKCLMIAGQKGMFGAAILASTAASRVGAGYVLLMTDQKIFNSLKAPDFITYDFKTPLSNLKFQSVGIGCGLGKGSHIEKLLKELKKQKISKVVIDADGLNKIAAKKLFPLIKSWVLTPHTGELSRLLNVNSKLINQNREKYILQAAEKFKCIILLKGYKTLICDAQTIYEIQTGNKALAKAGTGDVLTGMIAGFMAQGLNSLQAALLAATLHGRLADDWVKEGNDYLSLMASDLNLRLPQLLAELRCN
jgi:hydroxyethylthiazole kinase-like uncharacterized protein yjeF